MSKDYTENLYKQYLAVLDERDSLQETLEVLQDESAMADLLKVAEAERDALAARLAEEEAEIERLRDKWEPDTDEPLPGLPSWEMLDKANDRWLAAEARVAALTEALRGIAEACRGLGELNAVALATDALAAADRPEGTTDVDAYRLGVLASAVGIARLDLANGDPASAKGVLDNAAAKTREIIRSSLIGHGYSADQVDAFLGRPEGTTP